MWRERVWRVMNNEYKYGIVFNQGWNECRNQNALIVRLLVITANSGKSFDITLRYIHGLQIVALNTIFSTIDTLILHTYSHKCIHIRVHMYTHTCTNIYTHTCQNASIHVYMFTVSFTYLNWLFFEANPHPSFYSYRYHSPHLNAITLPLPPHILIYLNTCKLIYLHPQVLIYFAYQPPYAFNQRIWTNLIYSYILCIYSYLTLPIFL